MGSEAGTAGVTWQHSQEISVSLQAKKVWRRDLLILFSAVAIAFLSVILFDTGSLAEWLARHKSTKVDELIVVTVVLAVSLGVFSIRRWRWASRWAWRG